MYLNEFSVRIPEGNEASEGYVAMRHGTQYTIVLRNDRNVRCDAKVEIDGQDMGTYRLNAVSNIRLERAAHDNGRFTFYKAGSTDGNAIGLDTSNPNLGLIKVTFTPEMPKPKISSNDVWRGGVAKGLYDGPAVTFNASGSRGLSAGGTGLSGYSGQGFTNADIILPDYSQQTIIHLRLGAVEDVNTPRPLTPYSKANPVPPPLNQLF